MGRNVKRQLASLLVGVESVPPELFDRILLQTGASVAYLKRLLRQQTIPLHPLVEGVRQDSLDNLTRTLTQLSHVYIDQPQPARAAALESKRRAQFLLAKKPNDSWRNLVLLHLNIWLENPGVYSVWARLQKQNAANSQEPAALH